MMTEYTTIRVRKETRDRILAAARERENLGDALDRLLAGSRRDDGGPV